jgi:hypothetical protein
MDRYGLERRLRSGRRADLAAIFANKLLQRWAELSRKPTNGEKKCWDLRQYIVNSLEF